MQKLLLLIFLAVSLSSCASQPRPTRPASGNVGRLMNRPDYAAAKAASPSWTKDSLDTTNDLEYQNALLRKK